ncbi:MAG: hypothetical protein KJ646_04035 [Nanoarchaeota archaeon]|nr:hypothetical protein [Nanoarchaeota archaeon]MBU4116963.1 hypothetical protein [Nanoarchaeota archaeon]
MTSIQEHERKVKELQEDINEKINRSILLERQEVIGFSASELSSNLFAIFLHKKNLINLGFNMNHRFFASVKRANSVFDFEFKNKNKIIELMIKQEEFRNKLCYGKAENIEIVKKALENLNELKQEIENANH